MAAGEARSPFREDLDVPWEWRATNADYRASGFDKGHIAPAADNAADQQRMRDCFLLSNMMPQTAALNRGPWKQLENHLREIAETGGEVWVVTLPVFLPDPEIGEITIRTLGKAHRVWVPTHCAKVALIRRGETLTMRAWLLPNDDDPPPFEDCLVATNTVESAAALDFFAGLPDEIENELESRVGGERFRFLMCPGFESLRPPVIFRSAARPCPAVRWRGRAAWRVSRSDQAGCRQTPGSSSCAAAPRSGVI